MKRQIDNLFKSINPFRSEMLSLAINRITAFQSTYILTNWPCRKNLKSNVCLRFILMTMNSMVGQIKQTKMFCCWEYHCLSQSDC